MRRRDTALVVDDSVDSLNFLSEALEAAGLTVLVALSGEAAMTLIERVVPDIILMDAVMPGMDGFEACRRLKQNTAYVDLPVIFMTGLSETEHIIRGFQAGGADYVTKPIVPDELIARIRRHLSTAQNARSARAAIDLTGRFLIAVDRMGQTVWCTPQASRMIGDVLGSEPGTFVLPPHLLDWLNEPHEGQGSLAKALISGHPLAISYIGKVSGSEIILRLSMDDAEPQEKRLLQKTFLLTERESDVLFWVSAGKTNRDIAEILSISHRTVNKYLDQVYSKMSVENRASATALAIRAMSMSR